MWCAYFAKMSEQFLSAREKTFVSWSLPTKKNRSVLIVETETHTPFLDPIYANPFCNSRQIFDSLRFHYFRRQNDVRAKCVCARFLGSVVIFRPLLR